MHATVVVQQRITAADRREDIRLLISELKSAWQDTDDGEGCAEEIQPGAKRGRVLGEALDPQTMRDDHCGRGAPEVVLRREIAAERRPDSERIEEPGRDLFAIHVLGLAGAGDIETLLREGGDPLEGTVTALPIEEIGIGELRSVLQVAVEERD